LSHNTPLYNTRLLACKILFDIHAIYAYKVGEMDVHTLQNFNDLLTF